ncbi:MAG TPA: hypothetical protein VL574_14995, partial [Stellaceae bacterium]|nr:hypothetical protein [Stellaceae bacterium]
MRAQGGVLGSLRLELGRPDWSPFERALAAPVAVPAVFAGERHYGRATAGPKGLASRAPEAPTPMRPLAGRALAGRVSALALTVGLLGVSASPVLAQTVAAPSVAATALPQGGQVVVGAASIQQSGASM